MTFQEIVDVKRFKSIQDEKERIQQQEIKEKMKFQLLSLTKNVNTNKERLEKL